VNQNSLFDLNRRPKTFWYFSIFQSEEAKLLAVSQPAAQMLIDRLVDAGILSEITGGRYKRVYLAEAIVRLIETDHPEELNS